MKQMKSKTKKRIIIEVVSVLILAYLIIGASCSSCSRNCKSVSSDVGGGLDRIVNIYDYQGDKIASYEGKIDVEENDSKVLFDLNGKRYIYYNCLV
jgi:hypothetical protein